MERSYRIDRILVPVDGSEYAHGAADHAVRLAQDHGAEVLFLHVVDDHVALELAEQNAMESAQRARQLLLEHGRACVHDVIHLAKERGVRYRQLVTAGDPCAVVCGTAAREKADLIVVGKLGRSGARRILMGSITRRVIESSELPVLVVSGPPRR